MTRAVIDWLDARLGVREFYRDHLAYPLPDGLTVWSLFGGLTIGCIIVQFATGFYMLSYYLPEPELAHESIKAMCNTAPFGALFRNVHRWSATFGVFFLMIHFFHIIARRAFRPPRELNWWTGMTLGFLFILLLTTGVIMPWDWRSYWELIMWADWIDTIPLAGVALKKPMLEFFSLGWNFSLHVFLFPVAVLALLVIHLALFRKLGMSVKP